MVTDEDRDDGGGSLDRDATKIIRDLAETTPPKSIETIKAAGKVAESALIEERIRRRAYQMWDADGRPPGDGSDYWTRAERELFASAVKKAS